MPDEHLWTDLGGGLMGNHQISDDLLGVIFSSFCIGK